MNQDMCSDVDKNSERKQLVLSQSNWEQCLVVYKVPRSSLLKPEYVNIFDGGNGGEDINDRVV